MVITSPRCRRRTVLSALGTAVLGASAAARIDPPPVRLGVRVAPDSSLGWSRSAHDAFRAVRYGLEQVRIAAEKHLSRTVELDVAKGTSVSQESLNTRSANTVLRSFEKTVESPATGTTHLLLVDDPFGSELGYGAARGHLADADGASWAFVNVGATEFWDTRAVTNNMSIHEVLHTLLTDEVAMAVGDSACEHNLGAVAALTQTQYVVTPMATAYADSTDVGGETQWHGSGCYDHGEFADYDAVTGLDGVRWRHTPVLSDATLRATTEYLRRL